MQSSRDASDVDREVPAVSIAPEGIIAGDPTVLAALCERRARAVLSYCRRVSAPGLSAQACAEAFAEFRRTIAQVPDPEALDPDAALLRETRYAAAAHAPDIGLPPGIRGRIQRTHCGTTAFAMAARDSGEISLAACRRLASHIRHCVVCRETDARALAAEREYRDPPIKTLPRGVASAVLAALEAALNEGTVPRKPVAATASAPDADLTENNDVMAVPARPGAAARDDAVDVPLLHEFDLSPTENPPRNAKPASAYSEPVYAPASSFFASWRRKKAVPAVVTSAVVAVGAVGLALAMSSPSTSPTPSSPPVDGDAIRGRGAAPAVSEPPARSASKRSGTAAGEKAAARQRAARARSKRRRATSRVEAPSPARTRPPVQPVPQVVSPPPASVRPPPAPVQPSPAPAPSPLPSRGASPSLSGEPVPSRPIPPGGDFSVEGET